MSIVERFIERNIIRILTQKFRICRLTNRSITVDAKRKSEEFETEIKWRMHAWDDREERGANKSVIRELIPLRLIDSSGQKKEKSGRALLDAEKEGKKNEREKESRQVARMPVKAALKRSRQAEKKERKRGRSTWVTK